MKLILLYGPPAVGKLTIAKEISKETGISVFHNHMMLNPLSEIFGLNNPTRAKLEYEFRLRIVEEAIAADKDLIMTGVIVMRNYRAFYEKVLELVEKSKGKVYMVQLTATESILKKRVIGKDRKEKGKIHTQKEWLSFAKRYPEMFEKANYEKQLTFETSDLTAYKIAKEIIDHFKL